MPTTYQVLYIKTDPYGYWNPNTPGNGEGRRVAVKDLAYQFTSKDVTTFGFVQRVLTAQDFTDLSANVKRIDINNPSGSLLDVDEADQGS